MRRLSICLLVLAACSAEEVSDDPLADSEALSTPFDANRLIDDADFFAPAQMDADAVQRFLARLPSGKASFLASTTVVIAGKSLRFSDALAGQAKGAGLSPLVLLATLQKESGLVSVTSQPRASALAAAFGCGCPDGSACSAADAGLAKQLLCAAQVLGKNGALAQQNKPTVSGWKMGVAKQDVDGVRVTPISRGTAVLYTYTPLVRSNKLFHTIYTSYRGRLGLPVPSPTIPPVTTVDLAKSPDLGSAPDFAGAPDLATTPDLGMWSDMGKTSTPVDLAQPDLALPDLALPSPDLAESPRDLAHHTDLALRRDASEPELEPVPYSPPVRVGCSAAAGGDASGSLFLVAWAILVVAQRTRRRPAR